MWYVHETFVLKDRETILAPQRLVISEKQSLQTVGELQGYPKTWLVFQNQLFIYLSIYLISVPEPTTDLFIYLFINWTGVLRDTHLYKGMFLLYDGGQH